MISYKQVIPVLLIILVTVAGGYFIIVKPKKNISSTVIEIPFKDKQYKLDYSSSEYKYTNITSFEEEENWQGEGRIDGDYAREGRGSLMISATNAQVVSTYLDKKVDLSKVNFFTLFVFLPGEPEDLEWVILKFINLSDNSEFSYPITLLQKGWNFVRIPREKFNILGKEDNLKNLKEKTKTATKSSNNISQLPNDQNVWENIDRISFDLKARPASKVVAYLDRLAGESSQNYLNDWVGNNEQNMSLGAIDNNTHLRFTNINYFATTLKKVGNAKDYSFKTTIYPNTRGRMGIFFRGNYTNGWGYYFYTGGVGTNTWSITKLGSVGKTVDFINLTQGEISNFSFEKDKPYDLKVTVKGNRIKIELSVDGKNYNTLAETNDSSYISGGIGISVNDNAAALFDNFEYNL